MPPECRSTPASNPNHHSRSPSLDKRRDSCSCRRLALGNGGSPVPFIGESSRSRSARDGGDDECNRVDGSNEDDDNALLNTETFIKTLSASNQPILKQLIVFLKDKEDQSWRLPRSASTRSSSCTITRKEVDLVFTSIRMTLAMYLKPLSSLASSTPIPSSTSSR